jgi:hypothetical protein
MTGGDAAAVLQSGMAAIVNVLARVIHAIFTGGVSI